MMKTLKNLVSLSDRVNWLLSPQKQFTA